jgi:carbon-monoxide dehydrogenase large subunit
MGIEGVGARVARKEDKRFITGAGRYVDDMVVPGMKHAAFVRSPHAHAQIKKIDVRGPSHAWRHRRADRQGTQGRRHRQSHLRLDDPFQGRLADEDGGMVATGFRPVRYVGDAVVVVVAETKGQARDAAEAVEITYKELKAVSMPPRRWTRARRRSIPKPTTI